MINRNVNRRDFLKGVGKVSALSLATMSIPELLAACGNTSQSSSTTAKLAMWWWGEQEAKGLQGFVTDSVSKFLTAHTGDTVQAVLQADESLIPGFTSACLAKHGPDVQYQWGGSYTMQFVFQGCVTPISDLLPSSELAHIFKNNLQETSYKGKVYGLPWYTVPVVILYSKPAFRKAGLDPENPPATWDDFTAAIPKLRAAGYTPWGYGVQGLTGIGVFAGLFILQDLDKPTDIMLPATGQASFTDAKYSGWLQRIQELIQLKAFNDDVTSVKYFDSQNLLVSGKAAMVAGVETMISGLDSQMGAGNLGVMALPKAGTGALAGKLPSTAQQLFVTGFSNQKSAAASLISFLHSAERLAAMYQMSSAISPDDRFDSSQLKISAEKQVFALQKNNSTTHYQNYWPAQMDRENLFLAVQALFSGQQTPSQAAAAIQGRLKTWQAANADTVTSLKDWLSNP